MAPFSPKVTYSFLTPLLIIILQAFSKCSITYNISILCPLSDRSSLSTKIMRFISILLSFSKIEKSRIFSLIFGDNLYFFLSNVEYKMKYN